MSDDDRDDPQPKRMIYEIRRRVQAARNQYWAEGVDGEISNQTHRELAIACLQYYDVLYEFRGESVLDEGDFPDISIIRDRVGHRVPQRQEQPGLSRPAKTTMVPAVTMVPVDRILDLTEDLDDLAKKLGFAAKAAETTPHNDIDHDDLRALLANRGQDEALEKVPGGG